MSFERHDNYQWVTQRYAINIHVSVFVVTVYSGFSLSFRSQFSFCLPTILQSFHDVTFIAFLLCAGHEELSVVQVTPP